MSQSDPRVLLIAENWPPRLGGIENYLTNIAKYLAVKEMHVIAPNDAPENMNDSTGLSGVKVIPKRFFWPLVKPAWLPLWWYISKKVKLQKTEVVLCGKALFEGLIGYYLKKKYDIPYIIFTYGMEIEEWKKTPRQAKKLKKVLSNAYKIVCINEVTKKSLVALGVNENKIVKIWPGVDNRFLSKITAEAIEAVLKKYDIEKPYVLTVARLIERKGVDTLIEAFSDLDQTKFADVQLVIAGEGPDRERLEKLSENLWIDTTVKFIGSADGADLPALYKGAEVFALTPRNVNGDIEGFGIVYLEANAAGTPVLGTFSGGVPEAVKHKESGILVKPNSPFETRKALEYMLGNKQELDRLGKQGKKRAHDEFRWKIRITELDKIIKEAANHPRG